MIFSPHRGLGKTVDEETPCNPLGIYGTLKYSGEMIVKAYNRVFDIPYTIVRPSALYGERCVSRRVSQIFIENAVQGLDISIDGDGSDKLDFTYIDDVVEAIIRCSQKPATPNSDFNFLFRNIKLSLIGVVPNFIAAFFILGIIGLLEIPLDMMTITIAAITIGIAVDNSIHYIYRFKEEFSKIKNYDKTIKKCHSTVGIAILNTSITIIFGFSILVLSKFIPTIYFGVFTGIAMLLAMLSVLTLLPSLILVIKPFGKSI